MIYVVRHRETISDLSSAIGFTSTYIPPTDTKTIYAVIQAIGAEIRYTIDGTDPVAATTGLRLTRDSTIEIWGEKALTNFKCIDDGGTAKLEVIYMGEGGA